MKSCGKKFQRKSMSELRVCGEYDEHFEDITHCDYCKGWNDSISEQAEVKNGD